LISHGVLPLGGVKQEMDGKIHYFRAKCVNISKTVRDRPKLLLVANRKVHNALSIDTTIDDLG